MNLKLLYVTISLMLVGVSGVVPALSPTPAWANPIAVAARAVCTGVYNLACRLAPYAAQGAVEGAVGWGLEKGFQWVTSDGKPDTARVRDYLKLLAAQDPRLAPALQKMIDRLRDDMSVAELHAMLMEFLAAHDTQLHDLARKVQDHDKMLREHRRVLLDHQQALDSLWNQQYEDRKAIGRVFGDLEAYKRQQAAIFTTFAQDLRTTRLDITHLQGQAAVLTSRMDEMERRYPRITPEQQSVLLAVDGSRLLFRDNQPGAAIRALNLAYAFDPFDPKDPGVLYLMAVAHRRLGDHQEAQRLMAWGVVNERKRALPEWFEVVLERVQGPDRTFISAARFDPVLGVRAPGVLYVPDTMRAPATVASRH